MGAHSRKEYSRNEPHGLDVLVAGDKHTYRSLVARMLDGSGIDMVRDNRPRYGRYRGWGTFEDRQLGFLFRALTGKKLYKDLSKHTFPNIPDVREQIRVGLAGYDPPGLKIGRMLPLWDSVREVLSPDTVIVLTRREDEDAYARAHLDLDVVRGGACKRMRKWAFAIEERIISDWPRVIVVNEHRLFTKAGRKEFEGLLREHLPGFTGLFWSNDWI